MRGLAEDWKFPVFCEFDKAVTVDLYNQLIIFLEDAGCRVLSSTCDQGGANDGLQRKLGISVNKLWHQNPKYPEDPTRVVFFLDDFVHAFKNWRNNLLDHVLILKVGNTTLKIHAKKIFERLFAKVRGSEISVGHSLDDLLLTCASSDRQTVSLAVKLLSREMATLLRQYIGDSKEALALADICDIANDGS